MKIYIWDKIAEKIVKKGVASHEVDIRYSKRWIDKFPDCFPKCMLLGNYTPYFNPDSYRWEILHGKREIKFNANHWL